MQTEQTIPEIGTTCKICGEEFRSTTMLSKHLRRRHRIERCDYYETYINPSVDTKCPYCGKERAKMNWWYRRPTCGSQECLNHQNSDRNKLKWADPEYKESQRQKFKKFWNSDEGKSLAQKRSRDSYIANPERALSGVRAMHKSMYVDSKTDVAKFRSYREKIRNTYLSQVGHEVPTELYLCEFPNGDLKVGVSKHASWRFYPRDKASFIKVIEMISEESTKYELELLVKYHSFLKDRGEGKTLSEYVDSSQRDNLIEDFRRIECGDWRV